MKRSKTSWAATSRRTGLDGDGPQETGKVIGVVNWSTASGNNEGCGGLTGVTPLLNYRSWIVDTARKFNSPLAP